MRTGIRKNEYHDAYGNLVQVGEHNGSSTYTTYYTYDGLQDLTNLTDANGNIRNFAYDGLGRNGIIDRSSRIDRHHLRNLELHLR